jgi:WD40 repeat protein
VPALRSWLLPHLQVTAVSVGLDKGLFIWDVRQDKPTRVVPNAHLHEITCCAINMRGGVVATGGRSGTGRSYVHSCV